LDTIALIKIRLLKLVIAPVMLLIVTSPNSASAAESFRFGLGNNNQIFTDLTAALTDSSFELQIKGGVPAIIRLDLVDIYADATGVKQPLPIDSNPFTPIGLVEYPADAGRYFPTNEFQTIEIPFKFKNIANIDRPVLGGLRISIVADADTDTTINVVSSIVATFAYYPIGAATDLRSGINPRLDLARPKFSQIVRNLVPFNLIPNLPRIYNQSPLQAELAVRNVGNIFLNTKTQLVVVDPRFFGPGSDTELFGSAKQELMLIPNQIGSFNINLTKSSQVASEALDIFSGIGIYQAITTSTGSLGTSELVSQTNKQWIIIFPWKYTLVGLVLLYLAWWQFRSRFKLVKSDAGIVKSGSHIVSTEVNSFNEEFERIMAKHRDYKINSDS
jgi:fluoride ion exporter CrcB/FEX